MIRRKGRVKLYGNPHFSLHYILNSANSKDNNIYYMDLQSFRPDPRDYLTNRYSQATLYFDTITSISNYQPIYKLMKFRSHNQTFYNVR